MTNEVMKSYTISEYPASLLVYVKAEVKKNAVFFSYVFHMW